MSEWRYYLSDLVTVVEDGETIEVPRIRTEAGVHRYEHTHSPCIYYTCADLLATHERLIADGWEEVDCG